MPVSPMPEAGQKAPDFTGKIQTGDLLTLSSFRGKMVALYFYPEDFTPACTNQACSLRDGYQDLKAADVVVIGVSPDAVESHERFIETYQLPFSVVADPEKEIMNLYGIWGEKNMYGKKVMGVKRTTFIIDGEGVIRHVFKRPDTSNHAAQILARIQAL